MMNGQKMAAAEVAVQLPESKVAAENISGAMSGPLVALSFMVTAKQSSTVSVYGFMLPIQSKWSFSPSFEYLVGVSAAVAAHSLLQLLSSLSRLLRNSPVFAYAMISAGAASSGVTNLNRTGIRHTALPNFCKPLQSFCDHVAVSIFFTFLSCFLLAASAVQEVMWLSRSKH
ncbi:unnamed protein product [Dovyalis caffra]|uniref:CASP-like protein n=1 Tax=Dovyalis caffra TaxID=77055 RepID=A0AAV1SSX6_9ROSI|nr:unnamed protein product [Dovyalis caffra]